MTKFTRLLLIFITIFIATFSLLMLGSYFLNKKDTPQKIYKTSIEPKDISNNYAQWYDYHKKNIELTSNFKAVNHLNKTISKKQFLENLKTGDFISLKTNNTENTYKLFKTINLENKIVKYLQSESKIALFYLNKEGSIFPNINELDIKGKTFDIKKIRGFKVIKCWFISCKTCVEEFPELNKMYDLYSNDKRITFLSLAFDKPEKLRKFLTKKTFKFPVIANQKKLLLKDLKIKQYPTHIILDSNNKIIKMVNNVKVLNKTIEEVLR